ncbi:MAG: DNA polymerase III subunit alpha [Spirochaetaceae bacterium]|nr:MAG: DNA polymerase III subunit alpha [Spirochaetaceae bacterium]
MYVPLWCKSNFSFLEGASHPEELVEAAAKLEISALALTDRDGLYGVVRAHGEAKRRGVHLIVGSQISVHGGGEGGERGTEVVLLAMDREGYARLSGLISRGRLRSDKGSSSVSLEEVCEAAPGTIAIWWGAGAGAGGGRAPVAPAPSLAEAFGDRLYLGVPRHYLPEEHDREVLMRSLARHHRITAVAFPEVLYHAPERRPLQDVVTAIRHNVPLHRARRRLQPNGRYYLRPPEEMDLLFRDAPRLLEATVEIARRCTFSLEELEYRYPAEPLPSGTSSSRYLRELVFRGADQRYPEGVPERVAQQTERELQVIEELRYGGYFLTMYEIVAFCRRRGILCQGRGSAANSVVCYCLGITAVDPVRINLLFERFLSRERAEPPDIDLDIEHHRREEVIRYMYTRYGRDRAAMVANIVRYRIKSAIRDVGKALDLSRNALDTAARLAGRDGNPERAMRDAGLDPNAAGGHFLDLVLEILDFPRHLSIHPGGFLLGSEAVSRIVPVENATMPGRTVIQWDKYDVEEMNLFKVDLLGLGALTHLDYCFRLLEQRGKGPRSMTEIPPEDPATYRLLTRGDTIGVFQLESRAQMAMLPRLKPRTFYDLVIEVSIIRPGPITGGMVHPYLRRRSGDELVEYPHPDLEPVLGKTLGVPLFQEQVMRVAVVAADYTPGEADQLRRDMAAWRRSGRIEKHRERIIGRMIGRGIAREFAERVFEQIRGFGEYGFPESHAASFALIAYATAWMRTHHPAVFACALLNAWPMGFYAPATIVDDSRRRGITVLPVDINSSAWDCTLEDGPGGAAIRMGLRYVKGLGEGDRDKIFSARGFRGALHGDGGAFRAFRSVRDVAYRTRLDEGALRSLSRAGAFLPFGVGRREALWEVLDTAGMAEDESRSATHPAADSPSGRSVLLEEDEPVTHFTPLPFFDEILWDYRASIHSARGHPLEPLREEITRWGLPDAQGVAALPDRSPVRYVGLVICRQRPGTAGGTVFITLEDEAGLVNLIVWKKTYQRYRPIILMASCLGVIGTVQSREGVVHVLVESCFRPDFSRIPADPGSRDFH